MEKKQIIFAISGVKNSGKTTLISGLLPCFKKKGLKTAVIKHDGHEFQADVPDTDTWKYGEAGAYGTAIFSGGQWMLVKKEPEITETKLIELFHEADVILLEGFKYSQYPKLEVIRKGNSDSSVCEGHNLKAIATDLDMIRADVPVFTLNDAEQIADFISTFHLLSEKDVM